MSPVSLFTFLFQQFVTPLVVYLAYLHICEATHQQRSQVSAGTHNTHNTQHTHQHADSRNMATDTWMCEGPTDRQMRHWRHADANTHRIPHHGTQNTEQRTQMSAACCNGHRSTPTMCNTHNTQHTTHNTQHTTHNTQHTTHNTQHTIHNTQHTTHMHGPPQATHINTQMRETWSLTCGCAEVTRDW